MSYLQNSLRGCIKYENTNNAELQKGIELLNKENSSSNFKGDIGGTCVWWDNQKAANF